MLNSLTPGGRVFLASNLDASVLQPLEAPGISEEVGSKITTWVYLYIDHLDKFWK